MSNALVQPRVITQADFQAYTLNWYNLVTEDDLAQLQNSFKVDDDRLMNYVYLTAEIMKDNLLWEVAPTQPCVWAKFALVPLDNDPSKLIFSIILYSNNINPQGKGHPYYCLAGVRRQPAKVEIKHSGSSTSDEPIPTPEAAVWIENWNKRTVGELGFEMLGNAHERLLGYTFPLSDFQNAWVPEGKATPELWVNFDMHTRMFPTPDPDPEGNLVFSTMIDTNTTPTGDDPGTITIDDSRITYYDISRPCPPYCDANWTDAK